MIPFFATEQEVISLRDGEAYERIVEALIKTGCGIFHCADAQLQMSMSRGMKLNKIPKSSMVKDFVDNLSRRLSGVDVADIYKSALKGVGG